MKTSACKDQKPSNINQTRRELQQFHTIRMSVDVLYTVGTDLWQHRKFEMQLQLTVPCHKSGNHASIPTFTALLLAAYFLSFLNLDHNTRKSL